MLAFLGGITGLSFVMGAGSAKDFKGQSVNYSGTFLDLNTGLSTNSNGQLTGASISIGGYGTPVGGSKTTATTCANSTFDNKGWVCE